MAKSRIEKGELLTKDKLAAKRTGGIGIRANAYKEIIGSRATRTIDENHPIMWSYFQD